MICELFVNKAQWSASPVHNLGREGPLGEGNVNLLRYSCLGNPMDRETWWATVHGGGRVRHDLAANQPTKVIITKKQTNVIGK